MDKIMDKIIKALLSADIGQVITNEPMKLHTTWKIGGPADLFILPKTKEDLQTTLRLLKDHHIPWMILGRGSNLLVRDGGIRGAVIQLGEAFGQLEISGEEVRVGAAYPMIRLVVQVGRMGLEGLEFAGGIPGSVGGAVYMNAGAHGSDISQVLKEATILWENGSIESVPNEKMRFRYRTSILQEKRGIVLEATFRLRPGERAELAKRMAVFKDRRMKTQPLQEPCAGSVFRNPPGDHAARLIEACGLKGRQIGDAKISEKHANFIVNKGHATAKDVLELIQLAQKEVYDRFSISLETEVLVMGDE
ncbi:UDP-N-acetylenolpyruvoylglucosamine reductase [[Clostridium] ultunense Esp]|nr:UDP-N-acetylenolpyruvoylglucosamine reductase [[Clostridium] ultunense Esp]